MASPAEGPPGQQRDRGGYLGFVAHEARNPLSTALWSAELLVRLSAEERGGPRGEKLSGMCLRALQRLRLLVEDHFLAERLEVGGIPLRPEAVPLRAALEAAASKAGLADAAIEGDEDLAVWGDRGLVERALEGLLAVAGRGNSAVRLEVRRSGDAALALVRGARPPPDAFAIPQKGTPSDPTGRALALHMALRVARALGGAVAAASDEYVLSLPLAPPAADPDRP
jgi:hypothetical protein